MRSALKNSAAAKGPVVAWPLLSSPPLRSRVRVLPALRAMPVVASAQGLRAAIDPPLLMVWMLRLPPAVALTLMASVVAVAPPTCRSRSPAALRFKGTVPSLTSKPLMAMLLVVLMSIAVAFLTPLRIETSPLLVMVNAPAAAVPVAIEAGVMKPTVIGLSALRKWV